MSAVNIYEQYFSAEGCFNGRERRGAKVMLISDSCEGNIKYDIAVTFFPHDDPEDFAVSYDAYFEKTLYSAKGRRSKKKEALFMEELREEADRLAAEQGAKILWDSPLCEPAFG